MSRALERGRRRKGRTLSTPHIGNDPDEGFCNDYLIPTVCPRALDDRCLFSASTTTTTTTTAAFPTHALLAGLGTSPCFASHPLSGREYTTLRPFPRPVVCSLHLPLLLRPQPHNPVSLQQMVLFGQNPSQGTLLRGSQFLLGPLSPISSAFPARLTTNIHQRSSPSVSPTE